MRARLALWHSGIGFELREILLKDKPQAMLTASAKGTVPVLLIGDQVIDESIDIMRWALAQSEPDSWSVQSIEDPLVERNDGYFKHYLDRYKYFDRYPDEPQQCYLEKACEFIADLEARLSLSLPWLNGDHVQALDIAIFPFVRQFAFVDKTSFDQLPYPMVQQWLTKLLGSDLFQSVMLKYPPWQPDQDPLLVNL